MDRPGDDGSGYVAGRVAVSDGQARLIRLFLAALGAFCLGVAAVAWWRGASVLRYLGPLAVSIGGFVVLAAAAVLGWRLVERL